MSDNPEALRHSLFWLESALNCPAFEWDADQREAAGLALSAGRAALAQQAATPTDDEIAVDSVAWAGFIKDYDSYNSGDPKLPFSELRASLAAVIHSAHPTRQAATPAPLDWTEIDARLDKAVQCLGWNKAQHEIAALLREVAARGVQAATPAPAALIERCAVAAWSAGMDAHNAARGLPIDARHVGGECAKAIRALPATPAPAELTAPPPLPDERLEFGLNCNLEDPSDDESSGFYAGARFAESVLNAAWSQRIAALAAPPAAPAPAEPVALEPGPWTVHGPNGQRSGYAVGRTTYGPPPWFAKGTVWLERRDRTWRQWRSAEAAQKVADEMNQDAAPPATPAPAAPVARIRIGYSALGPRASFFTLTDAGRALPTGAYDLYAAPPATPSDT